MHVISLIPTNRDRKQVICLHNTTISWRSVKQTLVATLSNYSEIIAIHKISRECIWSRSIIQHIKQKYGLLTVEDSSTILFEDNAARITQRREAKLKKTKQNISHQSFFYTHEL
jgi:hypothetical protein